MTGSDLPYEAPDEAGAEPPRPGPPPLPPPLPLDPEPAWSDAPLPFRLPFGEVLVRCLSVWGRNYFSFLVLTVVVYAPLLVGAAVFYATDPDAGARLWFENAVVPLVDYFFLQFLLTAALTWGAVQRLRGRPLSIGKCLSVGFARILTVMAVTLLLSLAFFGTCFALFIPGIYLMMVWYAAVPVAVVERPGVFASFGRSAVLTRGNRWSILGLAVVITLMVMAAYVVLMILTMIVVGITRQNFLLDGETSFWVTQGLVLLIRPAPAVTPAVVYYYLRTGTEGADAEDLAAVFE